MGVSLPSISGRTWSQFRGLTSELGPNGRSTDYRQFTVSEGKDYNFKIGNSFTSVQIVNQKNEVVANMKAGDGVAEATARLAPGTYTAVISQQMPGVNMREYSLDVTERSRAMILAGGGSISGVARQAVGQDSGVQKHTLNVVQGGDFIADMSMPYSRWAMMDKQGKVVASGDNMQPDQAVTDFMKKPTFKLEPGEYELVAVMPRNIAGEVPWNLSFVAKTAKIEDAGQTKERDIDRILRERESRLRQWATDDARKGTTTKTTA